MAEFNYAELAKCAKREVVQRCRVYPRLIAAGKLAQVDADREIAMMSEIALYFETKSQPKLL